MRQSTSSLPSPAMPALEAELDRLSVLCGSLRLHDQSRLACDLLDPIAAMLGAESAVCRQLDLHNSRAEILQLASIGSSQTVADDYLGHFHRLDPFLEHLSYSSPEGRDSIQRYYQSFLRPNGLIHHVGFILNDPALQQMWVFNFHRPDSAPDFSSLELARSRVIEACLKGQVCSSVATGKALLHELTAREQDIARAVARGLTNKQIASELAISPRTVENHLRNIYDKLKINKRTQLITLLH